MSEIFQYKHINHSIFDVYPVNVFAKLGEIAVSAPSHVRSSVFLAVVHFGTKRDRDHGRQSIWAFLVGKFIRLTPFRVPREAVLPSIAEQQ
jgi:hypothetical protein